VVAGEVVRRCRRGRDKSGDDGRGDQQAFVSHGLFPLKDCPGRFLLVEFRRNYAANPA
jgi:hypothetical protein